MSNGAVRPARWSASRPDPVPTTATCSGPPTDCYHTDIIPAAIITIAFLVGKHQAHGSVIPPRGARCRRAASITAWASERGALHGPGRVVRGPRPDARGAIRPAAQIHYNGPAETGAGEAQAWHRGKTFRGARSNDSTVTGSIAKSIANGRRGPAPSPRSIGCSCAWPWRAWETPAARSSSGTAMSCLRRAPRSGFASRGGFEAPHVVRPGAYPLGR